MQALPRIIRPAAALGGAVPISISFVAAGTGAAGTTAVSIPYPAGILAGDMLVIAAASRTVALDSISGWFRLTDSGTNGAADGSDTGTVYNTVFWKEAAGGETGTLDLVLTTTSTAAVMLCYRKTRGTWTEDDSQDDTSDASVLWQTNGTGLSHVAGDMLVAASASNGNITDFYDAIISGSGTMGATTIRAEKDTSLGNDCTVIVADAKVSSGSGSTWNYQMTPDNSAPVPAGATIMLRLRAS